MRIKEIRQLAEDCMSSVGSNLAGVLAGLSNDLADAVERAGKSVVAIHARRRIPASGIIWRPGIVVAASHTIDREEDITLTVDDGSSATAMLAGRDDATDLAVLRTEAAAPPAERTDRGALRVGNLALAVGRPGRHVTASLGVVSAIGGEWRSWQGGKIDRLIRLDVAIRDGFSGGPAVDGLGRVIGLNTSALARGVALTVPTETVDRVADQILSGGRTGRGYLGIATQPVRLPPSLAGETRATVGLVVVNVQPGSPAERGGMLLGDVIVELAGESVQDAADVLAAIGGDRIGRTLDISVLRGGSVRRIDVTVGERPAVERPRRRR